MSNAGSTGLNLQAANTVINVDLPWNPAVLEQRIARAHRMGQKRQVQVYLLVTEDTIEERLLGTLSAKHDLALAALDVESDVSEVELHSGMEELKRRLERLLGEKPRDADRRVAATSRRSGNAADRSQAREGRGRRRRIAGCRDQTAGRVGRYRRQRTGAASGRPSASRLGLIAPTGTRTVESNCGSPCPTKTP